MLKLWNWIENISIRKQFNLHIKLFEVEEKYSTKNNKCQFKSFGLLFFWKWTFPGLFLFIFVFSTNS